MSIKVCAFNAIHSDPMKKRRREAMSMFAQSVSPTSNILQDALLELPLNLLALLIRRRLAVECHEATQVELGLLHELDLANVDLREISY